MRRFKIALIDPDGEQVPDWMAAGRRACSYAYSRVKPRGPRS